MVKVRFAPNLNGYLHLGNARTALYNYLFARHNKGKFIVRIEDTDKEKNKSGIETHIKETLTWLGIEWDEYYCQSQRQKEGTYSKYIDILKSSNLVYPCFCSDKRLMQIREEMMNQRIAPEYDGRCRKLSTSERQVLIEQGKPYVLRFAVPDSGETSFEDLIKRNGKKRQFKFEYKHIGDFAIAKCQHGEREWPLFIFANTVDDYLMGITHVLRGQEHIPNTARQIILQKALGFATPKYAHLPTIKAKPGKRQIKLSGSLGATSVLEYKRHGYLPEAILNSIFLLGFDCKEVSEMMSITDMIDIFSLDKVGNRRGSIDHERLRAINHNHVITTPDETVAKRIHEYISANEARLSEVDNIDLSQVALVCKSRIRTFSDLDFLFQPEIEYHWDTRLLLTEDFSKQVLREAYVSFTCLNDFSRDVIQATIQNITRNIEVALKQEKLGRPIGRILRVTLTGVGIGPDLYGIMAIMGKNKILNRINRAIEF